MAQEGADLIRSARREDVLELASLLLDFRFAVHGEAISEEALGETMAANDADGAFAAAFREFNNLASVSNRRRRGLQRIMTGIHERLVLVRFGWMWFRAHQSESDHFFNC